MIPVKPLTAGRHVTYAADQPEYNPLPAVVEPDGTVHTRWQLTDDERRAILDGACITLAILTFNTPLQPLLMAVEGTDGLVELPPAQERLEHQHGGLSHYHYVHVRDGEIEAHGH